MTKYYMPLGNTDFKEIRETGLYYIDKTMLIDQLVYQSRAKVTLFTRPRRFGKSLNMSMLQHFFDIREDSKVLFKGLKITENEALCQEWMNRYPTILVSFKDVGGSDFKTATELLQAIISKLYEKHDHLLDDNDSLTPIQRKLFERFLLREASNTEMTESLVLLTDIMFHYYHKPVILLMDEYDVPMAKGDANGYYREITDIMRYMLSKALKDNPYLKMAVLTGCLRIAKESIFTGLNNPKVNSILDHGFEEFFGFTESEIDKLLLDTELSEYKNRIKKWYDGYRFGDTDIFCPWDVLNYISDLQQKVGIEPKNYWANTSGNDLIRKYLDEGINPQTDFETLLKGGYICKTIAEDITYENLLNSEENFWSVLLMTGYLTAVPKSEAVSDSEQTLVENGAVYLRLVNNEIRELFAKTIALWFKESIVKDERKTLFEAIWNGDAETLTNEISGYLNETISYYDYNENFYHAFLAGLLSGIKGYSVESNRETGVGRADIILKYARKRIVAIFEIKHSPTDEGMEGCCDEALHQIEEKKYAAPFKRDTVLKYGVAFHAKDCVVKKAE